MAVVVAQFGRAGAFDTRVSWFESSGQSYKHFTIVNYDSRVVICGIFKSGTTLES